MATPPGCTLAAVVASDRAARADRVLVIEQGGRGGVADYTAFARERAVYEERMVKRLNLSID